MAKGTYGDDSVWQKLLGRLRGIDKSHVKVGVLGAAGSEVVAIAAVHEFGSKDGRIPERSFIRATFVQNESELAKNTGRLAKGIIDDKLTPERALGVLGTWGQAQVKKYISSNSVQPPTGAAQNAAKAKAGGATTTLVDTGRLLGSISYEVVIDGDSGPDVSELAASYGGGEGEE